MGIAVQLTQGAPCAGTPTWDNNVERCTAANHIGQ